jgi:pilus assembly protein CpaF
MGTTQVLPSGQLADQVRRLATSADGSGDLGAGSEAREPHAREVRGSRGPDAPPDNPHDARHASPLATPTRRPGPTAVDHALVAVVRREVSDALAIRLREVPVADPGARRELARTLLTEVLVARSRERVHAGTRPWWTVDEEFAIADSVMDAIFGMGRLQPLIDDPSIENIEVTGFDNVWIAHADGREVRGEPVASSDTELVELIQALVTRTGQAERSFSTASPSLHLRLDDGSRLTAMAWVTPRPVVVIRRHRVRDVSLDHMVEWGSMSRAVAEFLGAAIRAGKNVIVTGGQNAGKTTMLRALAAEFSPMERFATIEREYELHLHELTDRHPRVVAMEARIGSSERDASGRASGEVTLSDLVVDALRMNVRRVIVGEVRGPEVVPMLNAMSVGDGSMCTLHARTASKALDRIVNLCLEQGGGMTDSFAYRAAADGIDFIVHLSLRHDAERAGARHRFVSEVIEVDGVGEAGRPVVTTVFTPGPDGRAVPAHNPHCLADLIGAGFDPSLLDQPHLDPVRAVRRAAR